MIISPNLYALNGWDCTDWPQVTWNLGLHLKWYVPTSILSTVEIGRIDPKWLGTWDPNWSDKVPTSMLSTAEIARIDLGLGTPFEVIRPNFHPLNGWDCTNWPQVTWNLGPHLKWYVPTSILSTVEIARIDLKWLGTWDLGPMWTGPYLVLGDWP